MIKNRSCCSGFPLHSRLVFVLRINRLISLRGVDIQEWLGHSDIGTTSNIYTHLDYSNKVSSSNAILPAYPQNAQVGAIGQ